jgi:hypothetical protein
VVQTVANSEHQFREHRRFAVLAEARDAVAQNGLLDQSRFPAGARPKPKVTNGVWPLAVQRSLHIPATGMRRSTFLGARMGIAVGIRDLPLFRRLRCLLKLA